MSEATRVKDLVNAKLVGRQIDPVGFIDELLEATSQAGEVNCRLASEQRLQFEFDGRAVEVDLDSARGKLRMLCARLSVLCVGSGGAPVSPYGGEGTITTSPQQQRQLRFRNTPDEQGFTIRSTPTNGPSTQTVSSSKAKS
jgi:hypothetical protein